MNYVTSKRGDTLTNEPYILSPDELEFIIEQNDRDIEECKHVTATSNRGESYYANDGHPGDEKILDSRLAFFCETMYRDRKTDGFLDRTSAGYIIRQGEHNSYYRGENQIYPKTQPSLFRALDKFGNDERQKELYMFVTDMRIFEFRCLLNRFDITKQWEREGYALLVEPLAQHYGLETRYLDMTSDLKVALFFATCEYRDKVWRPLSAKETETCEDKKYGVIFHIPGWAANYLEGKDYDGESLPFSQILPIGYQPFMRCHYQHGYVLSDDNAYPLGENIHYEKLRFRHNEKFSKRIFDEMNGGQLIYPNEGLNDFQDVIDMIKNATSFSDEAFDYAYNKNSYLDCSKDALISTLKTETTFGSISITKIHPFSVSRQRIRAFDRRSGELSLKRMFGLDKVHWRLSHVAE